MRTHPGAYPAHALRATHRKCARTGGFWAVQLKASWGLKSHGKSAGTAGGNLRQMYTAMLGQTAVLLGVAYFFIL